jgi:hypothetical protein
MPDKRYFSIYTLRRRCAAFHIFSCCHHYTRPAPLRHCHFTEYCHCHVIRHFAAMRCHFAVEPAAAGFTMLTDIFHTPPLPRFCYHATLIILMMPHMPLLFFLLLLIFFAAIATLTRRRTRYRQHYTIVCFTPAALLIYTYQYRY